MIKAEDFKWLDRVNHLFHLGSYLCLSGALTDCYLPLRGHMPHLADNMTELCQCGKHNDAGGKCIPMYYIVLGKMLNL